MKEHPILFSDGMVRAINFGTKAQTRRVMQKQPPSGDVVMGCHYSRSGWSFGIEGGGCRCTGTVTCPYGAEGDRLWVREAWRPVGWTEDFLRATIDYRADGMMRDVEPRVADSYVWAGRWGAALERQGAKPDVRGYLVFPNEKEQRWHPSIHLPRWASRIILEVTDVRVQRVQEISEEDAAAEGVTPMAVLPGDRLSHVAAFAMLWDSINHARAPWDSNPWVWAITFKRVDGA